MYELKHFRNEPLNNLPWVQKGNARYELIKTIQIDEPISHLETNLLCRESFHLTISNKIFDIATSKILKSGEYTIAEKWEYPYLKTRNRFYYPSINNPIGRFLIILGKENRKIPQGIHSWVNWEVEPPIFKKGKIDNSGCIRTKQTDIEEIFENLKLGSKLIIQ